MKTERIANFYVSRRGFLTAFVAGAAAASCKIAVEAAPEAPPETSEGPPVEIVRFNSQGERTEVVSVPKIIKNNAAWKQQLTTQQFNITRKAGTEMAFSGEYDHFYEKGVYNCVCCGEALFSSETKFNSGTGWPSFWAPIAEQNVTTRFDYSLGVRRREVLCTRCDSHLGHVFKDGPKPTYLRYCLNSAALVFEPISVT